MGPIRNEIVFIYLLVLFSYYLAKEGRQEEGRSKKMKSGNAPAAIRLPQLRHVAPLEPVWPLCTSRSPDLGSSLGHHHQSTSGHRCSYNHDCISGYHLAAPASLTILVSTVLGLVVPVTVLLCVSIYWSLAHTLLGSHSTRTAWCQPGIRSQVSEEKN